MLFLTISIKGWILDKKLLNNTISSEQAVLMLESLIPKVTSIQGNNPYRELQEFRESLKAIDIGPHFQIYEKHSKSALTYKLVFMFFAFFFISILSVLVFHKTSWVLNTYLSSSYLIKSGMIVLCSALSFISFCIGWRIKPEREAIHHLVRTAKYKVTQTHSKRQIEFGFRRFLLFCKDYTKTSVLKHTYREAVFKMHEVQEQAFAILDHISRSVDLSKEQRIRLYNQAILECRDKLNGIIHLFRKNDVNMEKN